MNLSRHPRTARPGFTLVELLVVIAIIAILVGLISAAVVKALGKGNETSNMTQIRQLAASGQAYQSQFKVPYFPSRIRLCKYLALYNLNRNPDGTPVNPLDSDSVAYLNQVWTRLQWTSKDATGVLYNRIDWNGVSGPTVAEAGGNLQERTPTANANNQFTLDGGQCLVFFLGGIPEPSTPSTPAGTRGFSTSPTNPAAQTSERISPFYNFQSNRLVVGRNPATPRFFYHYLDAYGTQPYLYFSSFGKRNGFNRYSAIGWGFAGPSGSAVPSSDCHAFGVFPYAEEVGGNPRYLNPDSFQIVSAGSNEKFGRGSINAAALWSYRTAGLNSQALYDWTALTPTNNPANAGPDDQANFHALLMGVPAE